MQRASKAELRRFLGAYSPEIARVALRARAFVLEEAPLAQELVSDVRDVVVFAYAFSERPADAFCRITVSAESVELAFVAIAFESERSKTCVSRASGSCCARR